MPFKPYLHSRSGPSCHHNAFPYRHRLDLEIHPARDLRSLSKQSALATSVSKDQGGPRPAPRAISFDFIVAPRPKYIPGSGPPLAPITIMPPHDKDGFIIDKVQFKRQLRYLVGYEEYPQLKVSVQPQNILDWISPYALEEWEAERSAAEEKLREEEELPALLAKDERKRKRLEAISRAAKGVDGRKVKRKRTEGYSYGKIGKRAKPEKAYRPRRASHHGRPSMGDRPDESMTYTSPKQAQHSQQSQPSLSTPTRKYAGVEIVNLDSDDEGSVDDELAIDMQFGLAPAPPSRSTSESADPLAISASNEADSSGSERRGSMLSTPKRHRGLLSEQSAVASTSSLEALKIYEELERKKKASLTPRIKYDSPQSQKKPIASYSQYSPPSMDRSRPPPALSYSDTTPKGLQPDAAQDDTDDDLEGTEYELNQILDEDVRYENGRRARYYLIDWVGDYEDSWEPAENVSYEAISEYKERNRKKRKAVRGSGSAESEMDGEYAPKRRRGGGPTDRGDARPRRDRNGRRNSSRGPQGHVVDDDDRSVEL